MELFKTTIVPVSNFATQLKGDTLFGQICWAIKFVFGEERLASLLADYSTRPFLVVSDGFAKSHLPKPKLPQHLLNETGDKKANRKKIWIDHESLRAGLYLNAKTWDEVGGDTTISIVRNSINYKSFSTGEEGFAPYSNTETVLLPKDVYCLIDVSVFGLDDLTKAFKFISEYGFGKDSSIGKGRFEFANFTKIDSQCTSMTYMALSPFSPNNLECQQIYYEPFTRFGKHGASMSNSNPFKNPIVMADTASVIHFDSVKSLSYIGKAITNISVHKDTVHQGYAIVIAIKELA
jgi:CRISPR-associated protein Csm4